ncbi:MULTISPECIES: DUF554 domain-containing protein [Clostridium]|uniref:Membrane protein n=1 Tax=Clostridium disporicum TaxID=84024 RepID=A0A174HHU0_9CLOT|nr:DUF554 domain-containing protein [Clostridium disporicum]MCD2502177.1 DUF554 domain-containing protein [Clostridium sp. NSJ-145]CUO73791.1 membrane protein [Clostridium disporicum]
MIGTIVNSVAVVIGCLIGFIIKGRLKTNISNTIMSGLGLCVLYIGVSGALKGEDTLLMIICIVIGALIGELIDIDKWLSRLGEIIERKVNKVGKSNISIAEGFVSASLLFCVGAMAIVGSLESGLRGNHDTLFAKSLLDGVTSIILTSTLGIGVIFSAVTIFIYQGLITLGAGMLANVLSESVINNMTAVGSLLIIGLGFNILGITKIKVANMLPAVILPVLLGVFM